MSPSCAKVVSSRALLVDSIQAQVQEGVDAEETWRNIMRVVSEVKTFIVTATSTHSGQWGLIHHLDEKFHLHWSLRDSKRLSLGNNSLLKLLHLKSINFLHAFCILQVGIWINCVGVLLYFLHTSCEQVSWCYWCWRWEAMGGLLHVGCCSPVDLGGS